MIFKWVLDLLSDAWGLLWAGIPKVDPPAWFTSSGSNLDILFTHAGSMSVWVNIPLVLTVGAVILSTLLISAAVKIARIGISLASAGGGSAG